MFSACFKWNDCPNFNSDFYIIVIIMSNPSNQSTREKSVTKDALWENCLLYIKDRIQDQAFQTWFD